ncbi:50S ribosomal protein L22 [Candidatus Saccharibacteria bacterium RIFCSPHIGHO2_12_FULL_49_19]|nr:MAG: 50S ribosomal protein L22 [Candidatus Saccharibacteria bacterium RIFCSPHIGHO2_01_FULL_49_21]OGL37794.1 MAG: 50S ribosomal protein L22 [Candidatus Saccharibacteria bacterium RIFCSPHIGHO2_12_FULL_49_19]OGL38585.1 MAG: 50S ribosomal protein L22 [Candidatus Saccharibacteria bacterium RIFCSPLOWO2_01_FULL_49_22]
MIVRAISKNVLISPRKVNIVAGLVRGRSVEDALVILEHTPRRTAKAIGEVIKSAKANAVHNHNLKPDGLDIAGISVTPGPRYRRYRPAARGRALPYQRQTSHIRVEVAGEFRAAKKTSTSGKKETA